MAVHSINPNLKLLGLEIPIRGYEKFFGTYIFRGDKTAIVDVGPKAAIPSLLSTLGEVGVKLGEIDYVVLTHIHIDHSGGIGTAVKEMSRAKVLAHSRARYHLIDPTKLWNASQKTLGDLAIKYGEIEPVSEDRIINAEDLMKLDLGRGVVLEVHLTPGHAPHHLSIFNRANSVLIVGEAAGVCIDGASRLATPPPFTLEETLASIDRLIELKPKTICYSHLGCYDNAPEHLRLVRQKILDWYEIVNSAFAASKEPEDILAILREKDRGLDYLDNMNVNEYARERTMLINSIIGLSSGDH